MRTVKIAATAAGGYELATSGQLTQAWEWYRCALLELADLRVFFACLEIVARGKAAGRCGAKTPRFDVADVSRLTGLSRTGPSVARLTDAGLLRFDEDFIELTPAPGRLVPVPRRMIRYLARCRRPSLIATVLGHLLRCLFYGDGMCRTGGQCKASKVAEQFGVDLRRVKAARAELVELGWLERVEVEQWRMNQEGGAFRINLDWAGLPPRTPPGGAPLPPPDSDKDPLTGFKDQKPATGVSIRGVREEDLKDTGRTLELHAQAVRAGIVNDSEADRLRVVAAAEHALDVATKNAPGLFATILRNGLFGFLTQDDEDAARRRIREHLHGGPRRTPGPMAQGPEVSDDARLAWKVVAAARRAGLKGDPFYLLRQKDPTWTRPRWDAAVSSPPRISDQAAGTVSTSTFAAAYPAFPISAMAESMACPSVRASR